MRPRILTSLYGIFYFEMALGLYGSLASRSFYLRVTLLILMESYLNGNYSLEGVGPGRDGSILMIIRLEQLSPTWNGHVSVPVWSRMEYPYMYIQVQMLGPSNGWRKQKCLLFFP